MSEPAYRPSWLEALNKTVSALRRASTPDEVAMRGLDVFCPTPVKDVVGVEIH